MLFEIWSEGYCAQGNSADASLVECIEADTFEQACDKLHPPADCREVNGRKEYYIWGCRLFDNEYDARKHFG